MAAKKIVRPTCFARLLSAALLLLLLPAVLLAAENRSIRFNRYTPSQGLSQEAANCIIQDRHGFMWFGTQEGLNRFDGYEFLVFDHDSADDNSLIHPFVWAIHEDSQGILWIGTEGGLDRYNPDDGTFTHHRHDPEDPASLSSDRVRVITGDNDGSLWIGTFDSGVNHFDPASGTFTRYHVEDGRSKLSSDNIRCIYLDRQDRLWVGTDGGGLNRLDRGSGVFSSYLHDDENPDSLAYKTVRSLCEDSGGRLWVGTYGGGVDVLDTESGVFTHHIHDSENPSSLSNDRIRCVYPDSQGTIWVATDAGLCEWQPDSGSFARYQHDATNPASLSDDRVNLVYEDHGGVLWVGTFSGLNTWNAVTGGFAHYRKNPGASTHLSSNVVWALQEDSHGALWIGTWGGGLNRLSPDGVTYQTYVHDPDDPGSLGDDRVMSLLTDSKDRLWVGTFSAGLDLYDRSTGTFRHYRHDQNDENSLNGNGVTSIREASDGQIWVGVFGGGVNRLDPGSGNIQHFSNDPENPASLSSNRVLAIFEDSTGLIWIGTENAGLNRFRPETGDFARYRHAAEDLNSLSSDAAWSIQEDHNGNLWIGTQGGGLNRWDLVDRGMDRPVFHRYTRKDGLPSSVIYGILEDDDGKLWISTNRGLSALDPRDGTFRNYETMHGLQSNEFNFGAYHKGADGRMYFGGSNGFNIFHPSDITSNTRVPPVALTGFSKLNQPVDRPRSAIDFGTVELTHRDYFVTFTFAALDFTAPGKNRYRYRLESMGDTWIDLGNVNRVTLNNLNPGRDTLHITGSNNDGVWNETGISLPLRVIPPPWRSWWAYCLYALALAAAVFAFTRSRVRNLQAKQRAVQHALADSQTLLKLLNQISGTHGDELSPEQTVERVVRTIGEHFTDLRIAYATIDAGGRLTVLHSLAPPGMTSAGGNTFDLGGASDYLAALDRKEPVICSHLGSETRFSGLRAALAGEGVGAFVHLPVHHSDEVRGLLRFEAPVPRSWSGNEIINMTEASQFLTVTIKNAYIDRNRLEIERRTAASLREKEALLKEIHHRVKNNLQVIHSLLNLQTDQLNDPRAIEIFGMTQNRINSMALIHDQLYHSDELAWIDFEQYAATLVGSIVHSYETGEQAVETELDIGDIRLDLDTAIPCGLIVNELVSNAFKYAFPNGRSGKITVGMRETGDNSGFLRVADNGRGIPEDLDITATESMGMQLVHIFTEQLEGEIALERNGGTSFTITFPLRPVKRGDGR